MKISCSWLGEYIDHGLSPQELALKLTMSGLEVEGIVPWEGEWILDVKVPPNRPDCLSHFGLARELGNLLGKKPKKPSPVLAQEGGRIQEFIAVRVEDKQICPRYAGRVVLDVSVRPSPEWLRRRIESVGMRSVNNVVDVTNFVLMELGQPLHAFDLDLLEGKTVIVRRGRPGESFTTLDGNLKVVDDATLLICDAKKPVALAGIMGGANSEIRPETQRIFLESAYFDPPTIRRASKRLFLTTESSYRFERGVDPSGLMPALDRAVALIAEVSGGKIARDFRTVSGGRLMRPTIRLGLEYANRLLGTSLTAAEVEKCLTLPGYEVKKKKGARRRGESAGGSQWIVRPPSWRVDISRPEDLIEEVARLTGYENIPAALPEVPLTVLRAEKAREDVRKARTILSGAGCRETITYSFISKTSLEAVGMGCGDPLRRSLPLRNPLSEDQAVMRASLVPGLLQVWSLNIRRRNMGVKIYEIGRVFAADGHGRLPREKTMCGILMAGTRHDEVWYAPRVEVDYFDLKGVVESLMDGYGVSAYEFHRAPDVPFLHSGTSTSLTVDGTQFGIMGRIREDLAASMGVKPFPYICELDLDFIAGRPRRERAYAPISKYPATVRDIAILVDDPVPAQRALDSIRAVKDDVVKDVRLFDLYRGGNIPPGKKSLAFRIVFSTEDRTLTDEEADVIFNKIVSHVETDLNAEVRKRVPS